MRVVNLSSRPFVNERPVVRLSVVLWVVGGLLLAVNIYSYSTYWFDSEEIRGEVAKLRQKIDREEDELSELTRKASAVDVGGLNDHAVFLNNLIRYRTFPWSRLFDELEEVLPKEVRLTSVQPVVERQRDVETTRRVTPRRSRSRRSSRDQPPPEPIAAPVPENVQEIPMSLRGFAKSDEVILDFVDTLFEHPSFLDPNFKRESLSEQSQEVAFEMAVTFLLERDSVAPGDAEQVAESDEAAPSPGGVPGVTVPEQAAGEAAPTAVVRSTFTGDEPPLEEEEDAPQLILDPSDSGRAGQVRERPRVLTGVPRDDRRTSAESRAGGGVGPGGLLPGDRSPSAGAGRSLTGSTVGVVPAAPQPSAGSAVPPPQGRSGSVTPPRLRPSTESTPEARPDREEPGTRPRFVEPNASGAPVFLDDGV